MVYLIEHIGFLFGLFINMPMTLLNNRLYGIINMEHALYGFIDSCMKYVAIAIASR